MAKTIVFTRQFDRMDCGPACILRSLSHLTREGVSVTGIRDALNQIGADSASFEMTMEQLHDKCPHYRHYWFIEYDVEDLAMITNVYIRQKNILQDINGRSTTPLGAESLSAEETV